ncbi:hypothetical protein GPECTOR_14g230 [Gonium pectorale]|uniref:Uncharacterized protein n=1 Tax=Gonium pectorale TaxID=33097 RepID=A0A150GMB5_GONPE|nr:hypothetical protein GPECTOR_14g230 [Gonium pectorale]|eukprot:KXZ50989.1 hypothetical protein GPECTOR_14g230 [Gonium pectorale]
MESDSDVEDAVDAPLLPQDEQGPPDQPELEHPEAPAGPDNADLLPPPRPPDPFFVPMPALPPGGLPFPDHGHLPPLQHSSHAAAAHSAALLQQLRLAHPEHFPPQAQPPVLPQDPPPPPPPPPPLPLKPLDWRQFDHLLPAAHQAAGGGGGPPAGAQPAGQQAGALQPQPLGGALGPVQPPLLAAMGIAQPAGLPEQAESGGGDGSAQPSGSSSFIAATAAGAPAASTGGGASAAGASLPSAGLTELTLASSSESDGTASGSGTAGPGSRLLNAFPLTVEAGAFAHGIRPGLLALGGTAVEVRPAADEQRSAATEPAVGSTPGSSSMAGGGSDESSTRALVDMLRSAGPAGAAAMETELRGWDRAVAEAAAAMAPPSQPPLPGAAASILLPPLLRTLPADSAHSTIAPGPAAASTATTARAWLPHDAPGPDSPHPRRPRLLEGAIALLGGSSTAAPFTASGGGHAVERPRPAPPQPLLQLALANLASDGAGELLDGAGLSSSIASPSARTPLSLEGAAAMFPGGGGRLRPQEERRQGQGVQHLMGPSPFGVAMLEEDGEELEEQQGAPRRASGGAGRGGGGGLSSLRSSAATHLSESGAGLFGGSRSRSAASDFPFGGGLSPVAVNPSFALRTTWSVGGGSFAAAAHGGASIPGVEGSLNLLRAAHSVGGGAAAAAAAAAGLFAAGSEDAADLLRGARSVGGGGGGAAAAAGALAPGLDDPSAFGRNARSLGGGAVAEAVAAAAAGAALLGRGAGGRGQLSEGGARGVGGGWRRTVFARMAEQQQQQSPVPSPGPGQAAPGEAADGQGQGQAALATRGSRKRLASDGHERARGGDL